jgi:hypothetical protein
MNLILIKFTTQDLHTEAGGGKGVATELIGVSIINPI